MFIKSYFCPKCCNQNLDNCGKILKCNRCNSTFEKKDFEKYDVEDILSIEEKRKILSVFNNKELRNIFNNIKNEDDECF